VHDLASSDDEIYAKVKPTDEVIHRVESVTPAGVAV
jgi:hypothetical protein